MLFPVQSLLSVSLDVQASLALFGRIFEYLDLPVDIAERPTPHLDGVRGDVRWRMCGFLRDGATGRCRTSAPSARRDAHRDRRRDRLGQDHAAVPCREAVRAAEGPCQIDGIDVRDVTLESLACTVGLVSQETYLFHAIIRDNLRFARSRRPTRRSRRPPVPRRSTS